MFELMKLSRRAALAGMSVSAFALATGRALAQAMGIATMQPGTLNHTTGSAIAKVLKEKAGINALVQPTAGEAVLIPLVGRGEAELGIANILEVFNATQGAGATGKQPDLRLIGTIHALRVAFWVRKDAPMKTIADLKGKRVPMGFSAMRTIDVLVKAMLATGGLTEKDVSPVLVPNVIRDADDFVSGASDIFFFAFGAPKVREVDAIRRRHSGARYPGRRHGGIAEDLPVWLSDAGHAESVLHRRRQSRWASTATTTCCSPTPR